MLKKSNAAKSQPGAPRSYKKPTLVKGPMLTGVTAAVKSISSAARCWVARAAFGESDIRWQIFRAWLLDDAPAWFRQLYIRHGESVGSWLVGRDGARRIVRTLMMPAIKRKLRG